MHPRVSLSAISTFPWSLDEDLAFYASAGGTAGGASLAKLEAAGLEDGARRLHDAGLRVTNLIGIGPFALAEPSRWAPQRDRVRRALDAAEAVGAECLILTTGPAGPLPWEDAADALADALAPLLDDARRRGIPFGLEHTNSLRVDVFRIVQVSDYAVGTLSTPNRLVPGDGDIPLERIVGQLLAAGYGGCFDLELIGPRIDEEGYAAASRRAIERLGALLTSLGA